MKFGMEKETLLFNKDYTPYKINKDIFDKNATVDFSDHQIELISNVENSIEELHYNMNELVNKKYPHDAIVWPLSSPTNLLEYSLTNDEELDTAYNGYLVDKYGKEMMLISGIHFNVSEFKSDILDMYKKLYVFSPLITQFFSFSPKIKENCISNRNTCELGFYNDCTFDINTNSIEEFEKSIDMAINCGHLESRRELYTRIRIKNNEYLELRFLDLNPFYQLGISYEQMKLLEIFIEYIDSITIEDFDYRDCVYNFNKIALHGLNRDELIKINNVENTVLNHTIQLLDKLSEINPEIILPIKKAYINKTNDLYKMLQLLKNNKIEYLGKSLAFKKKDFIELYPEYNLELSTKILMAEAEKGNYKVEVLDEINNVIAIDEKIVVQATKTSLDNYVSILMMENKYMTKYILEKNKIRVPIGTTLTKSEEIDYEVFKNQKMVIKPLDTNFGLGITMLDINPKKEEIDYGIKKGLELSEMIIIEEYCPGNEYRFLIIDNECVSVLYREAGSVTGNGKDSIKNLIEIKNSNPLRGTNYNRPLEKIEIDEDLIRNLLEQNLTIDSVLKSCEKVFFRKTSNVSTGGSTYEVSDIMPEFFKDIAVQTAKALDVAICGVDIIIENLYDNKYMVLEANFNPAIHIHTFPEVGQCKNPSKKIIELLVK